MRGRVERTLLDLGVAADAPIGVACSGGSDSVALAHLLAGRPGVHLLHVDHHLRDGSDDDAMFVRELADRLAFGFALRDVTVAGRSEAAARDARYAALENMADELGVRHVLLAHTMDDQAETVLLRLMRGGSTRGIAPVRGIFLRPLLGSRREELRAWLRERGHTWREDPTNADTRYDRNWVRHVLLPEMTQRRPAITAVLAREASHRHEDDAVLDALAATVVSSAESDDVGVFVRDFVLLPDAIARRVLRRVCRELGDEPTPRELDAALVTGGHVRCGGVDVWHVGEDVAFVRSPMPVPDPIALPASGELETSEWGLRLRVFDDARRTLEIRSRRPGDRVMTPVGHRKVQDVLVDARIPRPFRPLVPILADSSGAIALICGRAGRLHSVAAEPFGQTWSRELAWIR